MNNYDASARMRKNVRGFYGLLLSVVAATVGPFIANGVLHYGTPLSRILAVIIGVAAWLPMFIVIALIIARGDEFSRRIHLTAIAFAFAGSLLLITGLDWLERADFLRRPPLSVLWLAIAVLWFIAIMVTKRHYERGA
ncbi:MAG TPA: hypothetical protein VM100_14640 [Longimicrobiales bacterium]|nr:hypothetical protein [Longimicrobiales bacterium]